MTRRRLTREDWIEAALQMGGRVGFENLAVEPLAVELGTTKGSFYWHFADRAALLDAVLEHWEQRATRQIIEQIEAGPPQDRLAGLLHVVVSDEPHDRVEWRIVSAIAHPQIGPVVARVHAARTDYVEKLLQAAGVPATRARARILYATYLGHLQLVAGSKAGMSPAARRAFVGELLALVGR